MIRFDVRDTAVTAMLRRLQRAASDTQPAMAEVGTTLVDNIRMGFKGSMDPWRTPWLPLSPVTAALRKKGQGGQPLLDTGRLRSSVTYRAVNRGVEVGTDVIYARTHQFGVKQGAYGRTKRNGPIPWGNVPARPFMPSRNGRADLPADWQNEIIGIVQRRILEAAP